MSQTNVDHDLAMLLKDLGFRVWGLGLQKGEYENDKTSQGKAFATGRNWRPEDIFETGVFRGYIRIMEKKMETTIV